MTKTEIVLFFSAFSLFAADHKITAVRFGKLWDGEKVIANALVTIDGDRVIKVESGNVAAPAGAAVVDWSRYTGIPGMIDVHTHMTYVWDRAPGTRPLGQVRMPAVTVFLAQENARKTLAAGVTTVRDLGSQDYTDMAMKELIDRGAMAGPRMFVCGYGLTVSRRGQRLDAPAPAGGGIADGPEEVIKVVRHLIANGVDVIKMYGSIGGFNNVGTQQTYTYEEMKAAAETAHVMGKKIAIHSYGPEGARDAVRAGADSLEHAIGIDDATLAEMVKRGTVYVPTIDHNRYYVEAASEYAFPEGSLAGLNEYIKENLKTAQRALKAGVRFAMGSDAVFTMFGQNTRELGWFVKAGMTPEQALKTATVNAAELLGKPRDLGSVKPGFFADIVALDGDPLTDIQVAIDRVRGVMKGGKVVSNLQ
ncbi:MAG: amidohydrolase family protein [Acidobacteriaceae bacterium]|nr:amidohydrolase family protein [Acidobacteriaceae bacterium]